MVQDLQSRSVLLDHVPAQHAICLTHGESEQLVHTQFQVLFQHDCFSVTWLQDCTGLLHLTRKT